MHCIPYSEDFLAHHGILGMKWGVRRYQNKDGSLTEAGRERYSHGTDYTIPKTSKYYRVSLNPNGYNEERGRVFVSTNTADNEKWKQLFKDGYTDRKLYDVQMTSVRDIKVAGENTLKRERGLQRCSLITSFEILLKAI